MSSLWALLGIIILLGIGIKFLLNMKVSQKELAQFRKANSIKEKVDEAVAEKELEHKKDLSAASDFERATRMWNDKPPKAR